MKKSPKYSTRANEIFVITFNSLNTLSYRDQWSNGWWKEKSLCSRRTRLEIRVRVPWKWDARLPRVPRVPFPKCCVRVGGLLDLLATTHADSRTRLPQPSPVTRMRFLYSSEALRPRLGYEMHETWRANAVIAFPSSIRAESSPLSRNRPAPHETRGIDRNLAQISSFFSFPCLFILDKYIITELNKRWRGNSSC